MKPTFSTGMVPITEVRSKHNHTELAVATQSIPWLIMDSKVAHEPHQYNYNVKYFSVVAPLLQT